MGSLITKGVLKHGAKIGNATVISNRIETKGYAVPNLILNPEYITIHDVGDANVRGSNWYNALHNANREGWRVASWHITVDYDKIYQSVNFLKVAWHAGDGHYGEGNRKSIGIEHVVYTDKEKQRKVYENGAALVRLLQNTYGISLNRIVQHHSWNGKDCPYQLRHSKNGFDWTYYKSLLKTPLITEDETTETKDKVKYLRVLVDDLNYRDTPDWKGEIKGKLSKGTALTIIKKVKAKNGSTEMYLTKAGLYVTASTKYIEVFEK